MRSQLLFLFLLFISMYTFGQTGSPKPRPVTEYFNYKTLDQVFDTLINKFDFKITYDQAEVNKSRFSYSFNNTLPDNAVSYTHLDVYKRQAPSSYIMVLINFPSYPVP